MEVMVAVLILMALSVMGAQLGVFWSNSAKVTQSQASLQEAYSVAKSTALQNYQAQVIGSTAATLCLSGTQLSVYQGSGCSGTSIWMRQLSQGVSISLGGDPALRSGQCIALGSAGYALPSAGSQACTTTLTYSISAGSANVSEKSLY